MNNYISNIVNPGDQICATLECAGHRLASINGMNFTSIEAVKQTLLDLAGRFAGLAVITVRNCTQGWRDVTTFSRMRRPAALPLPKYVSRPHMSSQYQTAWTS